MLVIDTLLIYLKIGFVFISNLRLSRHVKYNAPLQYMEVDIQIHNLCRKEFSVVLFTVGHSYIVYLYKLCKFPTENWIMVLNRGLKLKYTL